MGSPKLLNGADMNSQKVVHVANGSASDDAAAFGQVPTALPPNGTAGGDLAGTYPNPTVAQSSTAFALTGTISPTQISADQNDYNPTGLAGAAVIRFSMNTIHTITGLAGGWSGRIISLHNVGTVPGMLANGSGSSSAANRFDLAGRGHMIDPAEAVLLQYDGTASLWRRLGPGPSGLAIYGDGSDGSVTFDGSTTILGLVPSSSTYTLTRDLFLANCTINNSVIVKGQYRIFCTGLLLNNGTIQNNGTDASGVSGGSALSRGVYGVSGPGGGGNSSGTATLAGNAGTGIGTAPSNSAGVIPLGGQGGTGGNSGGAGGTLTGSTANIVGLRNAATALAAVAYQGPTSAGQTAGIGAVGFVGGSGGGSGARTTNGSPTGTATGSGGGGGGITCVFARIIVNTSGTISANGGVGSAATGGNCAAGGGGGGGGGIVWMVYDYLAAGTETASGGTKGTGLNGASAAADGSVGTVIKIPNA